MNNALRDRIIDTQFRESRHSRPEEADCPDSLRAIVAGCFEEVLAREGVSPWPLASGLLGFVCQNPGH